MGPPHFLVKRWPLLNIEQRGHCRALVSQSPYMYGIMLAVRQLLSGHWVIQRYLSRILVSAVAFYLDATEQRKYTQN